VESNAMADKHSSQLPEGRSEFRSPFVPNAQAPELFEPTDRPLNEPSEYPQLAAMLPAPFPQHRLDTTTTQFLPIVLIVVSTVSLQSFRTLSWPTYLARDGRHLVDQSNGFQVIIAVSRGQSQGDGHALRIGQQVRFATELAPIYWTGACLRSAADRPKVRAVDEEALEVQLLAETQMLQEQQPDLGPDAGGRPITQTPPAGHTATATHFLRKVFPGDAGPENEDNAGKGLAIIEEGPSPFGMSGMLGEERLNELPEMVGQKWLGHGSTLLSEVETQGGVFP
jgi:hypothetical protein